MNFKQFLFNFLISKIYRAYLPTNIKYTSLSLENKRCLCLAPHPDDESIGMGGALLKYSKNFDVICLTNGVGGITKNIKSQEKIAIRKEEFEKAMQKVKPNSFHFFDDVEDRELILYSQKFNELNLQNYDYIFIPNILDQHRDHKAVAILLKELLRQKPHKKNMKIALYEVWQTLALPNHYVDISDFVEQKTDLINTYQSQLEFKEYTSKIIGLNSYRGLIPNLEYAEAFCVLDEKMFKKICKIYSL